MTDATDPEADEAITLLRAILAAQEESLRILRSISGVFEGINEMVQTNGAMKALQKVRL